MAIGAHQLRFQQWMATRQTRFGTNILVTLITCLSLADPLQHPLSRRMRVMAVTAGEVFHGMSAAIPVHQITLMTIETDRIPDLQIGKLIRPEGHFRKLTGWVQRMISGIAVAGPAAISRFRCARIIHDAMGGAEDAVHFR